MLNVATPEKAEADATRARRERKERMIGYEWRRIGGLVFIEWQWFLCCALRFAPPRSCYLILPYILVPEGRAAQVTGIALHTHLQGGRTWSEAHQVSSIQIVHVRRQAQ